MIRLTKIRDIRRCERKELFPVCQVKCRDPSGLFVPEGSCIMKFQHPFRQRIGKGTVFRWFCRAVHHQELSISIGQWFQDLRIGGTGLVTHIYGTAADRTKQCVFLRIGMHGPEHIPITAVQLIVVKRIVCVLEQMLRDAGRDCFANRSGSNLERGIAADFAANASLFGRPKRRCAVIECDEAAFRRVCGEIKPAVAVVTNVFRDQLDRYGEVTHTLSGIREGLRSSPSTQVCLNADCSLTASLAPDAPDRVRFFGMDADLGRAAAVSDAPRCIFCGAEYEYDYHTFAHLGGFRCPKCGYSRTAPDVAVVEVDSLEPDSSLAELRVDGEYLPAAVSLPAAYNLYNAAAAVAAATALGIEAKAAVRSLAHIESGFGRMERIELDGTQVTMVLVKNPAGCDRAIDYLAALPGEVTAVFCLNDEIADGTDVSWIWDAAFERLFEPGCKPRPLIVSGIRAEDMRLRLKYAGAAEEDVRLIHGVTELIDLIAKCSGGVCILPTYTAMLPLRAELASRCGRKEFWK